MSKIVVHNLPSFVKARKRTPSRIQYLDIHVPEIVTAKLSGKAFLIRTFGCQANVRDEESMAGILSLANMKRTENENEASVIIINTCAVREGAEQKIFGQVGNLKGLKSSNKDLIVIVAGCVVQQEESLAKLRKTFPFVDIFMGTNAIHKLLTLLETRMVMQKKVVDVPSDDVDVYENVPTKRIVPFKAFVNITFGCDKFCTYCIVPYTRGKERSRRPEDILNECQILVDSGYQEITLVGQNVNAYGLDLKDGTTFSSILEAVAKLGIPRLRFITSHPWNFNDEMIDIIAKYPNIMRKIHLPLQSGSDEVLALMGRRYTVKEYLSLVQKLRAKMPDISLTTDIIVGFPNETEAQFLETLKVVEQVNYENAFTFIYSPRQGTPAARMADNVSREQKSERFDRLKALVDAQTEANATKYVGNEYLILVDGHSKKDASILSGYTESDRVVHFVGNEDLIGTIVKVKITESRVYSFFGELVNG
ncbi:MAG: (Dimethylallyl)adenosine tRNA methylthiotransferase MiaB [Tenericutes bacterium ADurb.Bin024]|nr:MAG: (Dimethylallyl)adenosine tRNA methylthiotransferase MiaB [Tenericutes bacterium ADurb.Bin024]